MPEYTFVLHFPNLDVDRQYKTVKGWGANVGTAFNRAWKTLKQDQMYQGIKGLRPRQIDVEPRK